MSELPKRSPRHASGELGIATLKTLLPTQWIVREQLASDYGIDVEIEIAETHVTGLLFKGQVRAKSPIVWRADNTFREAFSVGKLMYWRAIKLPVVLFLVDNERAEAFWAPASAAGPDADLPGEILVEKKNKIPGTEQLLVTYAQTFVHREDAKRMLNRLPNFLKAVQGCEERVGYDCFIPLEPEEYSDALYVYSEILLLRQALRLTNSSILPWPFWLLRSNRIFGDSGELHNGVFDEMIGYLRPVIKETVAAARAELDKENATLDNIAVKNALGPNIVSFNMSSSAAKVPPEFWTAMEQDLEKRGALIYRVKNQES